VEFRAGGRGGGRADCGLGCARAAGKHHGHPHPRVVAPSRGCSLGYECRHEGGHRAIMHEAGGEGHCAVSVGTS